MMLICKCEEVTIKSNEICKKKTIFFQDFVDKVTDKYEIGKAHTSRKY